MNYTFNPEENNGEDSGVFNTEFLSSSVIKELRGNIHFPLNNCSNNVAYPIK